MTVLHEDPYRRLGVGRDADQATIRKAYRRLAKESHPDLHPGDAAAEERFRKINQAYDILGDADRRARFDRGEIGPDGAERAPFGPGMGAQAGAGATGSHTFRWHTSGPGDGDFGGFSDIFADLFGHAAEAGGRPGGRPRAGADVRHSLTVSFEEMAHGARKTLRLHDGGSVTVRVPAGVEDGQVLRLKGKGQPGPAGAPPGDALVTVKVAPHPQFRRDGLDVHLDLPIGLAEAVLGGKVIVPTPGGPVSARIAANSSSGVLLRLKGKGVHKDGHRGDLYARLRIVLPAEPDPVLSDLIRHWAAGTARAAAPEAERRRP
jgi:DnaJ-class molecular chaperone